MDSCGFPPCQEHFLDHTQVHNFIWASWASIYLTSEKQRAVGVEPPRLLKSLQQDFIDLFH